MCEVGGVEHVLLCWTPSELERMAGGARPSAGSVRGSPICPTIETAEVRDLVESIL